MSSTVCLETAQQTLVHAVNSKTAWRAASWMKAFSWLKDRKGSTTGNHTGSFTSGKERDITAHASLGWGINRKVAVFIKWCSSELGKRHLLLLSLRSGGPAPLISASTQLHRDLKMQDGPWVNERCGGIGGSLVQSKQIQFYLQPSFSEQPGKVTQKACAYVSFRNEELYLPASGNTVCSFSGLFRFPVLMKASSLKVKTPFCVTFLQ